jgi:VWFA-related protein
MGNAGLILLLAAIMLLCPALAVQAQTQDADTVRIKTRVVFIDTLVKDKRTGQPVKDLSRDDFQVYDDGSPRTLAYFSREGEARERPLALVFALDLWGGRSFSYLKKAEVAEQLIAATRKLSPDDEVGVMLIWAEEERKGSDLFLGRCQMVESLTRDREKTAAALRAVAPRATQLEAYFKSLPVKRPNLSGPTDMPARVSQGGLACVSDEVSRLAAGERTNAQVVTVILTDDLVPFDLADREASKRALLASGVTVDGLLMGDMGFADKIFFGVAKPYVRALGSGFSSVEYFAKQTGGEARRVTRPEQFAGAVEALISSLAARYSLGFTLRADEQDDGRLHKLEVKVKARDARGKERKLAVSARRGYYMSETASQTRPVK